jgi:hypothetical protein
LKLTNKHRLPRTIVNAIEQVQSEYTGGDSDLSASSVTTSPRIYWLTKRHKSDIKEDASDLVWSLIGTLVHGILEKAAANTNDVSAEERLYKEINGWKFSGQYDLIEDEILYDHKLTSVWAVLNDHKFEWEAQLNSNRLLLHESGKDISKLEIIAILRDWSKIKSKTDKKYPQTQIKRVKIPLWPLEKTEQYLQERVALLQSHENTPDDELPLCTKKEMWQDETKYAVMKKGGKRAVKLYTNQLEANIHAKQIEDGYVEIREGVPKRCADYCQVNKFCSQWKEYNAIRNNEE